MKFRIIPIIPLISLMIWGAMSLPGRSHQSDPDHPQTLAQNDPPPNLFLQKGGDRTQTELTKEEIITACIQERAETLPQLYSDVPPNHWAFKAVQTMAYCGAYRSATPPALIEELLNPGQVR
jgi:hypothetical protein